MGHKALVTIDLTSASQDQRNTFYEALKEEKWRKIDTLTTSWSISFNDGSTRAGVIRTLISDLTKARDRSRLSKVSYAIQLDLEPVEVNSL